MAVDLQNTLGSSALKILNLHTSSFMKAQSPKEIILFICLFLFGLSPAMAQNNILYVNQDVAGGNESGDSWANAIPELRDALDWAANEWDGSNPPLQIWVAAGLYTPIEPADTGNVLTAERQATFRLVDGVEIYGGFAGFEPSGFNLAERNFAANLTILSGDIDGNDTTTDGVVTDTDNINGNNSYQVVTGSGTNETAILDGVTITGGRADGSFPSNSGGGMYNNGSSPTLANVFFSGNLANGRGGGMINTNSSEPTLTNVSFSGNSADSGGGMSNSSSSPTLANVTFSDNTAGNGGGMHNNGSSPTLASVNFIGNSASGGGGMANIFDSNPVLKNVMFSDNSAASGGGMSNSDSSPTLVNVTFSENTADFGGGMYNSSASPSLFNVTISGNSADSGGGGMANFFSSSSPTLANVIIWGNSGGSFYNFNSILTISYSLIQGSGGSENWDDKNFGTDGGNNLDVNPVFTDPDNGDYSLKVSSPAVNAGDPGTELNLFPTDASDIPIDLAGSPRVMNGNIDMGAYEYQGKPFGTIIPGEGDIVYVNQNVNTGTGDYNASGDSWINASPELRKVLDWAQDWNSLENGTLQIWVASGHYTPVEPDDLEEVNDEERHATFQLVNGVEIYGGFAGGETSLELRNWEANIAILSGDIDKNDNADIITDTEQIVGNNSYTVVTGSGTDASAVLDGFTITAGSPDSESFSFNDPSYFGGGMFNLNANPTLVNMVFSGNRASGSGGAMYNNNANPTLFNVVFSGNRAKGFGGAMANNSSNPSLTDVTFSGNFANSSGGAISNSSGSNSIMTNSNFIDNQANGNGGGIYNSSSSPVLINAIISGNQANRGGGVYNISSSPILVNVNLSGNQATENGGGFHNITNSNPSLTNVIIWGNNANGSDMSTSASIFNNNASAQVTYSLIANSGGSGNSWNTLLGNDLGNNIDTDPLFTDSESGDYRLTGMSPAINAGTNTPFETGGDAEGITTDLAGNDRIFGDTVDLGAYEFQAEPDKDIEIEYVEGWNLAGIPVNVSPQGYPSVFTKASQPPFLFNTVYEESVSMGPGIGYWVHLTEPETVTFPAAEFALHNLDLELNQGWNLVSGLSQTLPETAVVDNEDIIFSHWYGFNGAYFTATDIEPGYGYWVRASEAGTITLEHSASKMLDGRDQQLRQQFTPEEEFYALHFTAGSDTLQTLWFGGEIPKNLSVNRFTMPPVPPTNAFDARFAAMGSYLAETSSPQIDLQAGEREVEIHLQSPGMVSMQNWEMVQMTGDGRSVDRQSLRDGEAVDLHSPDVTHIELVPQGGQFAEESDLPNQFALEQNYPNPFNPTTQIRYQLPAQSEVRLDVYDLTGRHVTTLVNGQVSAGTHMVTFDSSNLSSGVYMYRLQAGEFQQVRRLTVIK